MKHRQLPAREERRDWNSHQRGGYIVLWLWQGASLTNRDVARLTGLTVQGAHKMMLNLEAAFPITHDGTAWRWAEK